MKHILTASLLLISICVAAQKKHSASKSAPVEQGSVMLKGGISFDDLMNAPSYYWMKEGAHRYIPDEAAVKDMERTMWRYNIVVFMATWDTGSQNLVPKLYKVMQEADMPQIVSLYAADRNKSTGKGLENKHLVNDALTIVVFDGDHEIGRITNHVKVSVEYDLADIALKYQTRNHVEDVSKTAAMPYFSFASRKQGSECRLLVR